MAKNFWRAFWWSIDMSLDDSQTKEAYSDAALGETMKLRTRDIRSVKDGEAQLAMFKKKMEWANKLDDHCWRWAYRKWINHYIYRVKTEMKQLRRNNDKPDKKKERAEKYDLKRKLQRMANDEARRKAPKID